MKRSSGPRKTATLSESVHQRLNIYALAAGAAGVGMLALTQPSQAKIVYTAAHITIPVSTFVPLDLNHDGVNDMSFYWGLFSNSSQLRVLAPHQNGVVGYSTYRQNAAFALNHRVRIGPKGEFESGTRIVMWERRTSTFGGSRLGPWKNVKNRFLGVKLSIGGKTHYGWVRLNVTGPPRAIDAVITGYAYETIPNKPIFAGTTKGPDDGITEAPNASLPVPTPEPATLGLLALGSPGLSIWRRKESVVTASENN